MNILLDSVTVALNDLIAACMEAAELYESAAERADRPETADGFRKLAASRRIAADNLAEQVRRRGDLPVADPNNELVVFQKAATMLRSLFAPDADAQLKADCNGKEAKIAEAAEALLDLDASEETHALARQIAEDARSQL